MKRILHSIVFFAAILLASCSPGRSISQSYEDDPSNTISYQQFYDDLSPYGQWIDNPEFGYVWAPSQAGFRPYYSNGNWVYTDYGWTWVSNYDWGWATFHYGRWFYDDFYGWLWVPGYEWAPAWVNWRSNNDYYGWAPISPRRRNGIYLEIRNDQWAFVQPRYINRRDINNYYINQQNNTTIINRTIVINNTRVINKTTYVEGPRVTDVEKVTKTRITPVIIKRNSTPGNTEVQNGTLRIFKPNVKQVINNDIAVKPKEIIEPRTTPASSSTLNNQGANTRNIKTDLPDKENQAPYNEKLKVQSHPPSVEKSTMNNNTNPSSQAQPQPQVNPASPQVNDKNEQPAAKNREIIENNDDLNISRQKKIDRLNERRRNDDANSNSGAGNNSNNKVNDNNTKWKPLPPNRTTNTNDQPVRKTPPPAQTTNPDNNRDKRIMNQQNNRSFQNTERVRPVNNQPVNTPRPQPVARPSVEKQADKNKEK